MWQFPGKRRREEGERWPRIGVERDEEDLVRLYLTDIGQYQLLTKDDEVELAQAIEAGAAARAELEEQGRSVSPARRRELRKLSRAGEAAERRFVQSTCGWWCRSRRSTRPPASRCWT
ncbi:MAG: hypothetical protein M5U19_01365 [Microthrixaceae bacterium]|nr:hypothetical protein [Microthrixaceae bacterium]